MSQKEERNFANAMAKVYNWLIEYHNKNDWFTFDVVTKDNNFSRGRIFPGRGANVKPGVKGEGWFYVQIVLKPRKNTGLTLSFWLDEDYAIVSEIGVNATWSEKGKIYDSAKKLANSLGLEKDDQYSARTTIAKEKDELQNKSKLFDWLNSKAMAFQVKDLDNNRIPAREHSRIQKLIADGYLVNEDGKLSVPDEAPDFPSPVSDEGRKDENLEDSRDAKSKEEKMVTELVKMVERSHNVVLTGAPGTGKTYLAQKVAYALTGDTKDNHPHVEFVQFHPSFDYTDFVEGLRPQMYEDSREVGFVRKDGIFKAFCKKALTDDRLGGVDNFEESWKALVAALDADDDVRLDIPRLSKKGTFPLTLNEYGVGLASRTYDETGNDWIRGRSKFFTEEQIYKVYMGKAGVPSGAHDCYRKAIVEYMKKHFGLKDFKPGTSNGAKDLQPYVLIIDEINRGDISKIFGELFFSIDPGYRGEAGRVKTQYSNLLEDGDDFKEGFYVPKNVYIIGTMNDIDRSVESMDFAIRRRFTWFEVRADSKVLEDAEGESEKGEKKILPDGIREEAKIRMDHLNEKIRKDSLLGSEYEIGPAYFLKLEQFQNDEDKSGFENLWKMNLELLLREYLRGNPKEEIESKIKVFKAAYQDVSQPSKEDPDKEKARNNG